MLLFLICLAEEQGGYKNKPSKFYKLCCLHADIPTFNTGTIHGYLLLKQDIMNIKVLGNQITLPPRSVTLLIKASLYKLSPVCF